jgi:hypothetical protein
MGTDLSAVGLILLSIFAMYFVVLMLGMLGWDYFGELDC